MNRRGHCINEAPSSNELPVVFVNTCFLHLLDRQSELTSRSDFLWQYKLSSEEEGVDTMRGINKILLENILPAHVAEHYLHRVQGISSTLQDSNVSLRKLLDTIINYHLFHRSSSLRRSITLPLVPVHGPYFYLLFSIFKKQGQHL